MAIGDLVQSAEIAGGSTSSTGTLSVAPTSDNLLIFVANNPLSFASVSTPPSGFTALTDYNVDWNTYWYYKISDGTETSRTLTWSHNGSYGHYLEIEWGQGTPSSVQTNEDESNVAASNSGPQGTSSITPNETTNVTLGLVTGQVSNLINGAPVWSTLTSIVSTPDQTGPGSTVAGAVDQTGSTSGSYDWTDGSTGSYGSLAVFNYTASGSYDSSVYYRNILQG